MIESEVQRERKEKVQSNKWNSLLGCGGVPHIGGLFKHCASPIPQ
jgi:hypothetical protein